MVARTSVALVVAALVFSPLLAVLTGLDTASLAAVGHAGRPLLASAGVAAIAATVATMLGVPFALIVDRGRPAARRACWVVGLLPLVVPPAIVAESAVVLFGPAGKVSRGLALLVGLGPADAVGRARFTVAGWVYTPPAAGVVIGACLFPVVSLAVAAAARRIDRRVFDSARLIRGRHGVGSVAGRLLWPPAVGATLLVFALALTESVVPQLLRVSTVGEAINERLQENDAAAAAALGLAVLPAVVVAGAAGAAALVRARSASLAGLEGEVPRFDPPGTRAGSVGGAVVTLLAVGPGLLVPAVALTWLTAMAARPPTTAAGHAVLRASGFADALRGAWDLARDDAVRTILLATVTATVAVALAVAVARGRWGGWVGLLGAGLAVPAPLVGLGLTAVWNHGATAAVYGSVAVVMLAWLARFLPLTVLLAQAALARVPVELEQAAALAGRGPLGRLASVVLPTAAPGLVAAWLATYVLCATETTATLLVSPPGASLLAPSVVNLMRRGQDPEIAACQMLLLAVVAAPVVVLGMAVAMAALLVRIRRAA